MFLMSDDGLAISVSSLVSPALPPPLPREEEFSANPIQSGRVFSNMYLCLSEYQEPHCYGNAFPGLTFTMNAPEDLCVKCLIRIAKETHDLFNDNNRLESMPRDLGNLSLNNIPLCEV
ncbi:hypothetical protein QL285_055856 [Trifolium repens]|nr:hypothetical protein QL285_055856 [Trifolium repens]